MITKIEIDGFKSFINFSMELRPLTVVVGANAAGKSNLFDALSLLSSLSTRSAEESLRTARGNHSELVHSSSKSESFYLKLYHKSHPILLSVSLKTSETFANCEDISSSTIFTLGKSSTSSFLEVLKQNKTPLPFNAFDDLLFIHNTYSSIRNLSPVPALLRKPSADYEPARLHADGSNLASALAALGEAPAGEGQTQLSLLRATLAQLVPGVRSVELRHDEEVAEHRMSIITRDGVKLPARLASDGTLRMIALLAAVFDPQGGTLCLEEPEDGLHPGQLRALIELLVERTAADATPSLQIILNTHSPVVLAALLEARRAAPEQIGIYFMNTARHIPEDATDPSQISTVSRVRRVGDEGESGRDVVPWREVERYLNTATVEDAP